VEEKNSEVEEENSEVEEEISEVEENSKVEEENSKVEEEDSTITLGACKKDRDFVFLFNSLRTCTIRACKTDTEN
jgi:hypothetical protein